MIIRHCQNIFFSSKIRFCKIIHLQIYKKSLPLRMVHRGSEIFFQKFNFSQWYLFRYWLEKMTQIIFLVNFSFFMRQNLSFKKLRNFRGELSLPLGMVHRGSDFPCEWFIAEVTSSVNGSPRKWLPLRMVHSGSDFPCEWFTTEVTLAVNGSPRKWILNFLPTFFFYIEI